MCHQVMREMAAHVAGDDNPEGQLMTMGTILGDQGLYEELHKRTRERIAQRAATPVPHETKDTQV